MSTVLNQVRTSLKDKGATHLDSYTMQTIRIESAGNTNAKAKTSSATGLYQFTQGTWERVMPGVSFSEATNPSKATEAFIKLTQENRGVLQKALGREPEGWELYTAHFAGSGAAPKVLTASENAPLSGLFSDKAMAANPHLGRLGTAGNYRRWVKEKYEGQTGTALQRMASTPAQGGGGSTSGDGFTDDSAGSQMLKHFMSAMQSGDMGALFMAILMMFFAGSSQQAQASQPTDASPAQPITPPVTPPVPAAPKALSQPQVG